MASSSLGVGSGVDVRSGAGVGSGVAVGSTMGVLVGAGVGTAVGAGVAVGTGRDVGVSVGAAVAAGSSVGVSGAFVGACVGLAGTAVLVGSGVSEPQATPLATNKAMATIVMSILIVSWWRTELTVALTPRQAHLLVDFVDGADGYGTGALAAFVEYFAHVAGAALEFVAALAQRL